MKRLSLTLLAALVLTPAAQAQFHYTAGDGTVLSSTAKPTGVLYANEGSNAKKTAAGKPMRQAEHYLVWAEDHFRLDVAFYDEEKLTSVGRYFFYLEDYSKDDWIQLGKNTYADMPQLDSVSVSLEPARGNVLMQDYNKERLESLTMSTLNLAFATPDEAQRFVTTLKERAAALAAKEGRAPSTRPKWATFTRRFEGLPPAPAAPKRPTQITVTLVNNSKYDVKLTVLDSPKATSSSDYYIAPGQTKLIVTKVGGQVRTRDGYTLLTITEQMNNTQQIIAK